jgi:hypothetical protein
LEDILDQLQSDFIVLSCDFVPSSSTRLTTLLNLWRTDITGMTMACLFYEASEERQKRKGIHVSGPFEVSLISVKINLSPLLPSRIPVYWKSPIPRIITYKYLCTSSKSEFCPTRYNESDNTQIWQLSYDSTFG